MNDWWNDPPEEDERDYPESNYDTLEEYKMDIEEYNTILHKEAFPPKCPHGKEWGSCDRCDFESDVAYDAWREKH